MLGTLIKEPADCLQIGLAYLSRLIFHHSLVSTTSEWWSVSPLWCLPMFVPWLVFYLSPGFCCNFSTNKAPPALFYTLCLSSPNPYTSANTHIRLLFLQKPPVIPWIWLILLLRPLIYHVSVLLHSQCAVLKWSNGNLASPSLPFFSLEETRPSPEPGALGHQLCFLGDESRLSKNSLYNISRSQKKYCRQFKKLAKINVSMF